MKLHELKTWPETFDALQNGRKSWDFRKDDRGFEVGDVLRLLEYNPGSVDEYVTAEAYQGVTAETVLTPVPRRTEPYYTARELWRRITYILRGPAFGLPEGHVIMSLSLVELSLSSLTDAKAPKRAFEYKNPSNWLDAVYLGKWDGAVFTPYQTPA